MTHHHNDGLRKICGCPRRTWAKCRHAWHFAFNHHGERYRFSLDRHLGRPVNGKTEAKTAADQIRAAIRAGEFQDGVSVSRMTLGPLLAVYHERYISLERPRTAAGDQGQIDVIIRAPLPGISGTVLPFGQWAVADITTDTIERFREVRREHGGGVVAVNRNLALLRACFNWAIRMGYRERTPFKRGTETRGASLAGDPTKPATRRRRRARAAARLWDPPPGRRRSGARDGVAGGRDPQLAVAADSVDTARGDLPAGAEDEGDEGPPDPDVHQAASKQGGAVGSVGAPTCGLYSLGAISWRPCWAYTRHDAEFGPSASQ